VKLREWYFYWKNCQYCSLIKGLFDCNSMFSYYLQGGKLVKIRCLKFLRSIGSKTPKEERRIEWKEKKKMLLLKLLEI